MRITLIGVTLGLSLAVPVTEVFAQNTLDCLKPWAVPDKWIDNHDETEPIDSIWTPDDTFETVDADGIPLPDADVYTAPGPGDPGTGFTLENDRGVHLTLKAGSSVSGVTSGWFIPVAIGNAGNGGNAYRTAIATCSATAVELGDLLSPLSGNLQGPTVQGVTDLIAFDPEAFWDETTDTIHQSCAPGCGPISPRVAPIALFDPAIFEQTRSNPGGPELRVTNFLGVFVDGIVKGTVTGYVATLPGEFEPEQ